MTGIAYRGRRFPPILIQHAVWLYLRFTLSYPRCGGASLMAQMRGRKLVPACATDISFPKFRGVDVKNPSE
jgi:hypothetical protein